MSIITRFAPSPSGPLHLGGARTALFNWIFSKAKKGKFLLRIEDTNQSNTYERYTSSIINNLKWLGIDWDEKVVYQSTNIKRHKIIAEKLLDYKLAYYCDITKNEILSFRTNNKSKELNFRNRNAGLKNKSNTVLRLKTPINHSTRFKDMILGNISINNTNIDDVTLFRSNGTPTYLLSCIIDDHDMNITHVIRGNDHVLNTLKQSIILSYLNWKEPKYGHLPLIIDNDGQKMSKRNIKIGIEKYKKDYLPEAVCNFLVRFGWSYKNIEIINKKDILKIFDIQDISKSPAKINESKLQYINKVYIQSSENKYLINILKKRYNIDTVKNIKLQRCLDLIKNRVKTITELHDMTKFFIEENLMECYKKVVISEDTRIVLRVIKEELQKIPIWKTHDIKQILCKISKEKLINFTNIMKALREAIFLGLNSPPILPSLECLGKEVVIKKIIKYINITTQK